MSLTGIPNPMSSSTSQSSSSSSSSQKRKSFSKETSSKSSSKSDNTPALSAPNSQDSIGTNDDTNTNDDAGPLPPAPALSQVSEEYEDIIKGENRFWKDKYDALQSLRKTESESLLEMLKSQSTDSSKISMQMITLLETRIGTFKENLEKHELEQKIEKLEKVNGFFGVLTSTKVGYVGGGTFECITNNKVSNKGVKYTLQKITSKDAAAANSTAGGNEYQFKCTANSKYLPSMLRETIVFDESQFPYLMKGIYNSRALFDEEE